MNLSICLDQYASNFDINNLSTNGFNIYTNLDNFTTPIAQGIPYQNLFSPPIGNCPYLLNNVPAGVTQILVVDNCTLTPPTKITNLPPTSQELTINCCYALIDVPQTPPTTSSFCTTCSLDFDVFSSSYVGQIVAGNLTSTCGPVTDYTIGWYRDGDYSSPEFISGFGNAFLPYTNLHPLTGNYSVPALAGDWEGIIHDIAINGITYSSVSGSAGGQPIPFESCFGTIVVEPLECDNGTFSGKYSHQFTFNSQAVGTTTAPVSLTYVLSPSTKYFAYAFQGLYIWDDLEIKWKSGNPAATSNPSLYSQPIYLEKIRIGADTQTNIPWQQYESTYSLPGAYPASNFDGQYSSVNNTWPKYVETSQFFQRVLTLTSLETSSNPLFPDLLEITVSPRPNNNNTQWVAGFQCLENFTCVDCMFEDYPNKLPKIYYIELDKIYGCDQQRLVIFNSSSCTLSTSTSDWMGRNIGSVGQNQLAQPNINYIGAQPQYVDASGNNGSYTLPWVPISQIKSCGSPSSYSNSCGSPSTGTITAAQSNNQIQLTFNLESDYLSYKNPLTGYQANPAFWTPITCSSNTVDYYKTFSVRVPIQSPTANCGDNSWFKEFFFHRNDLPNIQYVESPSTNAWSITIPQTPIVNCYSSSLTCDNCFSIINDFVNDYNISITSPPFSYTTNVGAKLAFPIGQSWVYSSTAYPASGSVCSTNPNNPPGYMSYNESQIYPWYGSHTIPFISSSNGWTNLPTLGAFIPCSAQTGSYPITYNNGSLGLVYMGKVKGYTARYLHLGGNGFDYTLSTDDFELYAEAGFGPTGSSNATTISPYPCPDPLTAKIYSYIGGVATMYSSSHFWNGTTPTLVID